MVSAFRPFKKDENFAALLENPTYYFRPFKKDEI